MKHLIVLHKLIRTLSVLFLAFMAGVSMHAQKTVIEYNVSNTFTNNNIVIPADNTKDYIITGSTTTNTVTIQSGYKGTITLDNLTITSSKGSTTQYGISGLSCITVEGVNGLPNLTPETQVNFILKDSVRLTYTNHAYCALQVNQGAQIHISAIDPDNNSSGRLVAKNTAATNGVPVLTNGGGAAAIGAPNFDQNYSNGANGGQGLSDIYNSSGTRVKTASTAGGNIIISSGIVKAYGGHGAGIGGGWYTYYNGIIIVYGGEVYSISKRHAAGIGSGCPTGSGVDSYYADNSVIVAIPPSKIEGYGTVSETQIRADYALAGARNITYMNDPNKSEITVHTQDYAKNANIYIDLSEAKANNQMKLTELFEDLEINYDLKKVRVGRTGDDGRFVFNAEFKDETTFFTDASSTTSGYEGRPYMPKVVSSITGDKTNKVEVVLDLLEMKISFTDYPSTPLEEGYTTEQARQNAHKIKMEYNDSETMNYLTFQLQGGGVDFESLIFLDENENVVARPTELNQGDIYYIVLPIKLGKTVGIYSDVLLIGGSWGTTPLPGYIRRIGEQRVVKNDTGVNDHIKVTADPDKFVDDTDPVTKTVKLTLNVNHTGTGILYDPLDVKAKYLITTEADYDLALAANPDINTWTDLNIASANATGEETIVSFTGKQRGTYYIHWYVESGVVYAHSQNVTNPPHLYGGFGPYILTEAVKAGSLTGNPSVCKDQTPSEIKGEVSTGGSGDFSYQWQISTNGTSWSDVGGNTQNYTPAPLTVSPTYFRRLTIDNQYGGTIPSDNVFTISIVADGLTFYWKQNTANNNWNDPANWVDASGMALNMVPVSCSNVYIPGGADNYPSLLSGDTPTDVYGQPVCQDITFGYGAELAYQHKLTYEKAYIQYNWGYYDNLASANYLDQPTNNASDLNSPVKERDKWYALAAPLKSMATGDFSFAGYPLTWQAGFSISHPVTGESGGTIGVGDFSKMFATNDMPLSETNNAIAVKVAVYKDAVGYDKHNNLEGLKGIVEIPYFENGVKAVYYPGHIYDRFTKESKFFYFNAQTLQLLHSPVGLMKRSDEAYRFIYEENGAAPEIVVAGIPSTVPGYKQKLNKQNSTSLKVMIGNPFMASINTKHFFDANSTKLNESEGYQLFSSTDQTWKHYSFTASGNIPPLQAFIVTLDRNEVDELLFPLEGTYALTGTAFRGILPVSIGGYSLYLKSYNNDNQGGDYSVLGISEVGGLTENVKKMISSESYAIPETFFIAPDNNDYNLIQLFESGIHEVGIGVKSSDAKSTLSLTFENVDKFTIMSNLNPVLVDKHTGAMQNLLLNNTYSFNQRQTDSKSQYVDSNRFVLKLLSSDDTLFETEMLDISILYKENILEVRSIQNIRDVQVYDMLGRRIHSAANVNADYYSKLLPLNQGVYVVKIYTEKGKVKVKKIMAL
jgi:hypothetical protein